MGTSGRFDGLCAASWRAHDAGSVSNPVRIEVTMTGSTGLGSTAMPWSMYLSCEQDSWGPDFLLHVVTLDITVGAQTSHAQRLQLPVVSFSTLATRWEASGGALSLTAQSMETYPYGHFDMNGVHGTLDVTDPFVFPFVVHATF